MLYSLRRLERNLSEHSFILRKALVITLLLIVLLPGCNLPSSARDTPAAPVASSTPAPATAILSVLALSPTPHPSLTLAAATPVIPTRTPPPLPSPTPTRTKTPHPTPTWTFTALPSPTPTYSILRGRVLQLSNCRYGPGHPYLYKYALIEGSNLEVIGRNEPGTWILVRAIGGTNPCWVKASLMEVKGDVMLVEPIDLPLPMSPYYGPLTGVWAEREGNTVILSWDTMVLRPGDDSEQFPYLVEAWVCQDGKLVFTPIGVYETFTRVTDEPGCTEPSHGRVYGVEKHGYTKWVEFPWPQP